MKRRKVVLLGFLIILILSALTIGAVWCQKNASSGQVEYRNINIFYGGLKSRIPKSWSLVIDDEKTCESTLAPSEANYSFSPDPITYSDLSWRQVDICVSDSGLEEYKDMFNPELGYWGMEFLPGLGARVDVFYQFADSDGRVSKGGTKGKDYFIPNPDNRKTVIISKQAEADSDYEAAFKDFIDSLSWN